MRCASNRIARWAVVVATVVAAGLLGGCQPPGPTYASPQDVFVAAKTAAGAKDWPTFVDCFDPGDLDDMVAGGFLSLQFSRTGPDRKPDPKMITKVHALYEKHDIATIVQDHAGKRDGDALLMEITEALRRKGQEARKAFIVDAATLLQDRERVMGFHGDLFDVQIEGDRAVGQVRKAKADPEGNTAVFRKVGGSWRLQFGLKRSDVK